jgi:hypothetical protein
MAITPPWALHVGAANCLNRLITIGLANTGTANNTSLTFTALDGQVVTFTENSTQRHLYRDRQQQWWMHRRPAGRVTSINIPYIANQLNGTFTGSAQGTFNLAGDIAQFAAQTLRLALKITGTSLPGAIKRNLRYRHHFMRRNWIPLYRRTS